ncbi:hypothetical protein [Odoribacter lunatus]|uniref:hypothetical protein n=1 Tax=Odoribacter lunatus TaxID=2941335 RepID=UPI002041B2EA|nr:hypothetical protein [Odoribacter lunatus]
MQLLRNARSGGKAVSDAIFLLRSVFHPKTLHLSTAHPQKHPATGISDGKKTEKQLARDTDRMLSGKLFSFLYVDNAFGVVDGELRSLKKTCKG